MRAYDIYGRDNDKLPVDLKTIVNLLKHPESARARQPLMAQLESLTGKEFSNIWEFVDNASTYGVAEADLLR